MSSAICDIVGAVRGTLYLSQADDNEESLLLSGNLSGQPLAECTLYYHRYHYEICGDVADKSELITFTIKESGCIQIDFQVRSMVPRAKEHWGIILIQTKNYTNSMLLGSGQVISIPNGPRVNEAQAGIAAHLNVFTAIKPIEMKASKNEKSIKVDLTQENKVAVLNKLRPRISGYHLEIVYPSIEGPRSVVSVEVDGQTYFGEARNEKLARIAAATAALESLIQFEDDEDLSRKSDTSDQSLLHGSLPITDEEQSNADMIQRLILCKFAKLTASPGSFNRHTVLAGIVMIENNNINAAKVICVSTGTKCIDGDYMSMTGRALNDSHAEIVARRCLVDFFYNQLELHTNNSTAHESIFESPVNPNDLYQIRDGIRFHLYISTAPCGDARVFSPHGDDCTATRKARGQLRTKMEHGEGTIPVKRSEGIQTWDGVMQGNRLLTMSCSDKIAKWNVLGLQGALLASLIRPVYLASIVIGSSLHPEHFHRAIFGRIETAIHDISPPYRLNKPKFALAASAKARDITKAPNFGINWTYGCDQVEVVRSRTGKTITYQVSRITKQAFFGKYTDLVAKLPAICVPRRVGTDYADTKESVREYQIAKRELFDAFRRQNLGNWLKKPLEQDQFYLQD